jgi:hypothetical protein
MFFDPFAEIPVVMVFSVRTIFGAGFCRFFTFFIFDLPPQIDVADIIEDSAIDIGIHSTPRAAEILSVCCIDMGKGLPVFNKRSYDIIHPLDALRSLVDPFPAGRQEFSIAVICKLGRIDLFIHLAATAFTTSVADIRGFLQPAALLRTVLTADITAFIFPAHTTGEITVHIAASMLKHTSGMDALIGLAWDSAITIELLHFGMPADFL